MKKGLCWAYAIENVGHIYIEGVIGQEFYKEVRAQLESPQVKNATSLVVHIQSPGGSVYAGYNTFHVLRNSGKPITSLIEGEAQSMATFISLAGSKKIDPMNGGIFINDPSTYMIHNPKQGVEGDADALQNGEGELRTIENEMVKAYSIQTGLSEDKTRQMMKTETRMSAREAKQFGFVDDIKNELKAVAIGKPMKPEDKNSILNKIANALGLGPASVDLKTVDGKAVHIEAADPNNLLNMPVTIEGVVAPDGPITISDGSTIMVMAGVVAQVIPAAAKPNPVPPPVPAPAVDPLKAYQDQIAALTLKLNAEAAQVAAAKEEKAKLAVALGEIKTDIEKMKKEPDGDQDNPNNANLAPTRTPVAFGRSGPNAQAMDAARTFLIQEMPFLEQYYPAGYFDKYKSGGPNAVSILETNFNYTYPGILTTDIFYKPTLVAPALTDFGMIDQDIKFSKKYNLVTQLDKIVQPYTGCGGTPAGNRQLITNTQVNTKEFQVYEGWCKDDFTSQLTGVYNFLAQEWLKTGLRQFDPAGTPIDTVIMTVLKDAIQRDVFRRFFFAAGNSSDSDYNQFDGYFDRLIDNSGASNYCVIRAGSSIAGALSAGNALTYLGQAYTAAKPILKNDPSATFFVTRTIWDNYYDSLIGNGSVSEPQFMNLQNGVVPVAERPRALSYKGYQVVAVDLWDQFLLETDNPLYTGTQRNLIVFTTKRNHIFGVENAADLNKIDSWYENKDQKRYYRANFKLGYNFLHCDLQVVMY